MRWFNMVVVALALGMFAPAGRAATELVMVWNDLALRAVRYGNAPPPVVVRQMAVVHLAMFDALDGIERRYQPYLVQEDAPADCSREAAVSAAAHHVLRTLFPKSADLFDSHENAIIATLSDSASVTNGRAWGRRVAAEFLRQRQFDGAGQGAGYAYADRPGYWARTPPNYDKALLPGWGRVKPFGLASVEAFRPAPPPALSSAEWASQYNLLKNIGATNSATRTSEQRSIALFWADGPGTETPPGHWNKIAQQLARQKAYSLLETARLFAALNVAMADAGVVCWDAKYTYNWWRPITAIRQGATDGNPATEPDAHWWPLLITPPFPEHTSGHSTFSGAAAALLAELSGSDDFVFITVSDGLPGARRQFRRFSDAALEAGMSRIYGGIHFPSANEQGLESGRRVGQQIARTLLQPCHPGSK